MLRVATLAQQVARLREQREEAKRAKAAEEAAEAKKRDKERRTRKLADRAARRAEAEKQGQAAEENREENERRAAIRAAKAAETKKAEEEAAREAADRREAAAQTRKAELAKQREREARMVVLRHVPTQAHTFEFTQALEGFQAGRILDCGVVRGTAWVEFWTAEQAKAFRRIMTETDQFIVCGTTILTVEIRQGRVTPPPGPDLITRSLYFEISQEFLDEQANMNEPVNEPVKRKLRERGFNARPVGFLIPQRPTLSGMGLVQEYSSVALAQSAKAVTEKHYPKDIKVTYREVSCGGGPETAQEDAGEGSGRVEEESDDFRVLPSLSHFVATVVCYAVVTYLMVVYWVEIYKDKSSDEMTQQEKQNKPQY